ncbi:MAG: succinate dehydrogenase cytochrome b subunit [Elusimicrobia bacterium]|nr:succinate dehydrogenase cytochrome b subunit [Elusimicrobiota bacterium]MDE2424602.1 succinate dehydrogenase cytochrome b subunit [Elusimicrobiota bacterium]
MGSGFFSSSIGRKIVVALAGLLLCLFLVVHLAGNLLIFAGAPTFNHYAAALEHNPLLPAAEIGLLALFLLHILFSLKLRWENHRSRPVGYAESASKGGRTPGSRTMLVSALLLLAFLAVHIKTFRFGHPGDSLYRMVMTWFSNPYYSAFYVLSMAALALHLSHGVQSGFQTLGLNHPRYTPIIRALGVAFAVALCTAFAAIPLWALLAGGAR